MNRLIIDTREPYEYEQGHVPGAFNTPAQDYLSGGLPEPLASADKDANIILYCRSGMRSNTVSQILKSNGFTNVVNGINRHHVAKLIEGETA